MENIDKTEPTLMANEKQFSSAEKYPKVHIGTLCDPSMRPNIPRISKFQMVSYEKFKEDILKYNGDTFENNELAIEQIYDDIKLPTRATMDSAGYDFYAPFSFKPEPHKGIIIPTGIRCRIEPGWVLKLYPRSGQGFKYGLQLYNTTGIIDGDYFYSDNEGHIMVKITSKDFGDIIPKGQAFCQGVFTPYGITEDDNVTEIRNGGLGSTTK